MTLQTTYGLAPTQRVTSDGKAPAAQRRPARDHKTSLEYQLIFSAAFLFFFFAAALERALPSRWATGAEAVAKKSVIGRARESAGIAAGYAFMG